MGFDKFKSELYSAGKYMSENATMAGDYATKKIQLKENEDKLRVEYEKLGRKYYEDNKDFRRGDFAELENLQNEVDRLRAELNTIKDTRVCPKCGSKQDKVNTFCANCGARM